MKSPFYLEEISSVTNSYELKSFRIQYNEEQLLKYLVKFARKHTEQSLNKIYLVRNSKTKTIVAWFGLKSATLPFNDKGNSFLIPAIEMTHFAVDERFKSPENEKRPIKTGEFIFLELHFTNCSKCIRSCRLQEFVFIFNKHPKTYKLL